MNSTAPRTQDRCNGSNRELGSQVARGQQIACPQCGSKVRAQLSMAGCVIPPHTSTIEISRAFYASQRAIDALCPFCKQEQSSPSCERREHWGV